MLNRCNGKLRVLDLPFHDRPSPPATGLETSGDEASLDIMAAGPQILKEPAQLCRVNHNEDVDLNNMSRQSKQRPQMPQIWELFEASSDSDCRGFARTCMTKTLQYWIQR